METKRLIDANGSYTINSNDNTGYSICFGGGIISVFDDWGRCVCEFDAEDAPTVDAVEVVRCKDCKNRDDITGECKHPKAVGWDVIIPEDNDFCSYGERKDNED